LIPWTANAGTGEWESALDGADAVVHLAGESIAGRRWTAAQKARIEHSRVDTTRALVDAIGQASRAPRLLLSGSAIGYYGSRGDEVLTEDSAPGSGFLAQVALRWEEEAARAASGRTRVVRLRTGVVLANDGGAFPRMRLPFRFSVGGKLGSGTQYLSWIHHHDWQALVHRLIRGDVEGPVNLVAPSPVTNAEFTRTLARVLGRPALLPVPSFTLKLLLGEMAEPLLLASQRVLPARALAAGFTFRYANLEDALRALC
jgi:uncharacterized protein (TIGR01777 family)